MTAYRKFSDSFDRYPWRRHLSMAEVMEYERLVHAAARDFLSPDKQRRLADLGSRRVRAVVEPEAGDAA